MGKYNSSTYRVRPLMELIRKDHDAYKKVLELVGIKEIGLPKEYYYDGGDSCKEKQLKPSKDHLEKLIRYISQKDFRNAVIKNEKRRSLCLPDLENENSRQEACDKAIAELNKNYDNLTESSKAWYMFEGFTNPDIFIEGEDFVIVCEGKWTESYITVQTTNLSSKDGEYRNQMIRHIQGALNYTDKKIYAFYIVDGECKYLDQLTREAFSEQISLETMKTDNPEKIMNAFWGYITWQEIERIIPNIRFKTKEEIEACLE